MQDGPCPRYTRRGMNSPPSDLSTPSGGFAASRSFDGKTALVTGAGSGIGRAVAQQFAAAGARVVLVGRNREKLEAVAEELPRSLVLPFDHADETAVEEAMAVVRAKLRRLDILINNAGRYTASPVSETATSLWQGSLDSNLTGPFLLTREALPLLRETRGSIVNVSSTLGMKPIPGAASYCVAKAGVIMLTQATALEEAPNGVRVNAVCPGVVDTPIHRDRVASEDELQGFFDSAAKLHPLGRIGTADEVAALILYLSSAHSEWTTGAVMPIDGGISLA